MKQMDSIRATFKQKFIAGLIVSIPALVTLFLIVWMFELVDGFMSPVYDRLLGRHVSGLGFVSAIAFVFVMGLVATNVIGKRAISYLEKPLLTLPILKSVYAPVKSIMDAFSNSSSFQRFVIVEYPRPGVYAYGFLTKESTVKTGADGFSERLMVVYIPTNHLYFGEIALFNPRDVFFTETSVEDGVRIVLSGGIATPPSLRELPK
jgi:uncharacterized membrane protein